MKTTHTYSLRASVLIIIFMLGTSVDTWAAKKSKDTTNKSYYEVSGKIVDKITKKALVFASIYVEGENTATISNLEGEFELKIDKSSESKNIIISYLGYKNKIYPIINIRDKSQNIYIDPIVIALSEVIINSNTAEQLLRLAIDKVPENYEIKPYKMTAFFREFIKKRKKYVSLAEAVLDIYKSDYINKYTRDQIKILKGRKGTDKRRLDTLLFKVQGGPTTVMLLDLAKNPDILFLEDNWVNYDFTMGPQIKIYDRINYVINFKQNYKTENPMYNGKLFIDSENLAITGAEFELNVLDEAKAGRLFLRKKPAGVKVLLDKAVYRVMYIEKNGKWYFNYAHGISNFNIKWAKKMFSTNYTTMFEIAITDRTEIGVEKIKGKERFRRNDYFVESVGNFYDADFWGSYNTIKPDDPIETAIKRIKKVNR